MNCPNCGAENDAEARFCAECGTPLEPQNTKATDEDQPFVDAEVTMMSSRSEIAAQLKTMTVDQAQMAAAAEESGTGSPAEPEPIPPPPPIRPPSQPSTSGSGGQNRKMLYIIIGVIVVLILCCCCSSILFGIVFAEDIQDALDELSGLIVYSTAV
jgi:hypothetical protein